MTAQDVEVMREAMRLAQDYADDEAQRERLPEIVLHFYAQGMTDAERLAAIALFLSSSRAFGRAQSGMA
jgi:hypothetical protein